jgi:hypothetical protein
MRPSGTASASTAAVHLAMAPYRLEIVFQTLDAKPDEPAVGLKL